MFELPIELIELDFVKIEFYAHFMISTPIEGITLNEAHVRTIQDLATKFYGGKSFGYISNRENDYSRNISPEAYTRQFPTLTAIAIVYKTETSLKIANFEKFFIRIPFQTFEKMNDAKEWMMEQTSLKK